MVNTRPLISVIIATTCEARREKEIRRAIRSVLTQRNVNIELLVVVNGRRFDPALLKELKCNSELRVVYREEASFPASLKFGRQQISGEYFCFLDDDDEFLPEALEKRLSPLESDPSLDFVATNGTVEVGGEEKLFTSKVNEINSDPLTANFQSNWLGSSAALFRTTSVAESYFDGATKHFEWTLLTFTLLLAGKKVLFLNELTFRKHDTPESLSKNQSADPIRTEINLFRRLLTEVPTDKRWLARQRYAGALHAMSDYCRRTGNRKGAWTFHLRSIFTGSGWQYLAYTRHLLS